MNEAAFNVMEVRITEAGQDREQRQHSYIGILNALTPNPTHCPTHPFGLSSNMHTPFIVLLFQQPCFVSCLTATATRCSFAFAVAVKYFKLNSIYVAYFSWF